MLNVWKFVAFNITVTVLQLKSSIYYELKETINRCGLADREQAHALICNTGYSDESKILTEFFNFKNIILLFVLRSLGIIAAKGRMKIEDKTDESSAQGFMFGLVILGPAAGKLKYTLLDKQDITLLQNHLLEAYVEIDRNGQGAQVFAFAYDVKKGKESGRYVHEILWEKYYGGIAPGFKVVHKNGITVDNRVENLMLCPKNISHYQCANQKNPEDSLYWAAVVEMPHEAEPLYLKLFTAQEELGLMKEERYFECHYPPCTKMEQRPQEFSICGLCQVTRYCSSACQTRDWTWHKPICNQRPRPVFIENYPDR